MQKSVKLLTFVFAGAALLQSCASDPIEIPRDELYAREFIKEFGVVQPGNPFNVATRCGVRVVTAKATDVKISAKIGGREYLFADYKGIDGTSDIYFDLPGSVKDIFVRANGKKIPAKVGDTVYLRAKASRATNERTFCNGRITSSETDPIIVLAKDIEDIMKVLPEEKPNTGTEGVYSDFAFNAEANDEMTVYPIFWNTSSHHSLGLYWLDEDGSFEWCNITEEKVDWGNGMKYVADCTPIYSHMQDIYQTRSGKLTRCDEYDPQTSTDEDFHSISKEQCTYNGNKNSAYKAVGIKLVFNKAVKFGFFLKVKWGESTAYETDENGNVGIGGPNKGVPFNQEVAHTFFSQALRNEYVGRVLRCDKCGGKAYMKDDITRVTLNGEDPTQASSEFRCPEGHKLDEYYYEYGFNSTAWNVNSWAQQAPSDDLNAKYNFYRGKNNFSRASYVHLPEKDEEGNIIRDRTYFGFEDWSNGPIDLNDLIFMIDYSTVTPVDGNDKPIEDPDPEPGDDDLPTYEWIIAAEDLGNTYDFDFNDMVVGINYVSGNGVNEIKVRPLAAGGIYPVYLMFDQPGGTTMMVNKELHNWFGRSTNQVTNAHENGEEFKADEFTITLPDGVVFSLAGSAHSNDWEPQENMGGFWLLVDKDGKYNSASDFSNAKNEHGGQAVVPNLTKGDKYAPQMICVGTDWCWPREGSHIHEKAYSGFADWIANPDKVLDTWYGANLAAGYTHNTNHTVKRKSVENYQKPTE